MVEAEARARLELGDGGALDGARIRDAYLRRAPSVRLQADPDGFMRLREAFELLTRGAGAPPEEVAAAREALAADPDSAEARWRLLSCLPYAAGPEPASALRDGAQRQPDAFVDELMFHFPERTPGELLSRASAGAGLARLLLIADVHATEGRPADALEALRAALAGSAGAASSPALLQLAMRPVLSLQIHLQLQPAAQALALLEQRLAAQILAVSTADFQTATTFKVVAELGRLDDTFPLDLRQVAARAAKRGDFQNAPYEAKFAARLMKPLEVSALNERLKREAPTLAGILGLSMTDDQLRPKAIPNVKIPFSWGAFLILLALFGSVALRGRNESRGRDKLLHEVAAGVVTDSANGVRELIERDCADPGSDQCRRWAVVVSDGTEAPDAGAAVPDPHGPDPRQ